MSYKPPVIKAKCRQIKRPDGKIDVVCEVPALEIRGAVDKYSEYNKNNKHNKN